MRATKLFLLGKQTPGGEANFRLLKSSQVPQSIHHVWDLFFMKYLILKKNSLFRFLDWVLCGVPHASSHRL